MLNKLLKNDDTMRELFEQTETYLTLSSVIDVHYDVNYGYMVEDTQYHYMNGSFAMFCEMYNKANVYYHCRVNSTFGV